MELVRLPNYQPPDPVFRVHFRSSQTHRKRHRNFVAKSAEDARKQIASEAEEIYEIVQQLPEPASERQMDYLYALGVRAKESISAHYASALITKLIDDGVQADWTEIDEKHPITESQVQYLYTLGAPLTAELKRYSQAQASRLIDKLKENPNGARWNRPTPYQLMSLRFFFEEKVVNYFSTYLTKTETRDFLEAFYADNENSRKEHSVRLEKTTRVSALLVLGRCRGCSLRGIQSTRD